MRCFEEEQTVGCAVGAKATCVFHVSSLGFPKPGSGYKALCCCSVLLVVQHSNHACSTGRPDLLPALSLFAGGVWRRPLGCRRFGEACKHMEQLQLGTVKHLLYASQFGVAIVAMLPQVKTILLFKLPTTLQGLLLGMLKERIPPFLVTPCAVPPALCQSIRCCYCSHVTPRPFSCSNCPRPCRDCCWEC